jgi:hypothetical protein
MRPCEPVRALANCDERRRGHASLPLKDRRLRPGANENNLQAGRLIGSDGPQNPQDQIKPAARSCSSRRSLDDGAARREIKR